MNRILFVDDDENVLQGLKVMLHSMRSTWEMEFAHGGHQAMDQIMTNGPFDIVVSDMHMERIQGTEVLENVKTRSPFTVRIALAGSFGAETLAQCSGVAHQILCKPCESNTLRTLLVRALTLRDRLQNEQIRETLHRIGLLPSVPARFAEMLALLQSPDASISDVGKLIARDPGLTAKVLQIVNSASVGLRHPVSDVVHATAMLGMENIRAFVLFAELFEKVDVSALPEDYNLDRLWNHALKVARYARAIAEDEHAGKDAVDDAYTAGLLHDIGLLIVAAQAPEKLTEAVEYARAQHVPLADAEEHTIGATHALIGGYLLDLWGISEMVVAATSNHFYPSALSTEEMEMHGDEAILPLLAVHVANYLAEDQLQTETGDAAIEVDTVFLERAGKTGRMEAWYDICYAIEA